LGIQLIEVVGVSTSVNYEIPNIHSKTL